MEVPGKSAERSLAGEFGSALDRNPAMPGCVTSEKPDLHLISRYQYQYDAQGNVTSDGENRYRYDSRNRLTEIETKDGGIQKNRYDGEGLRAELEENGELTRFLFSGREVVAEEKEEHAVIRYIRGIELLSSDCESARTYYHYACDELGSVTHVTDEAGAVLNRYTYDAFGNRTSIEERVENRFGFTGELLDGLTGQYYLRARFYSPAIGRFLQEDTYYGDGLNLYSYCQNNPVKYVDPSGHNGCPKEGLMEGKNRPEPDAGNARSRQKNQEGGVVTSSGNSVDFYVMPNGDAVPATGYRYSARNPNIIQSVKKGFMPARRDGTYFSFDKIDDSIIAQGKLQIPYRPEYRIAFDTLDIIDDISIPKGKWGTADYLEPITKDYKNFGPGGATQAITYSKIKSIKDIFKLR